MEPMMERPEQKRAAPGGDPASAAPPGESLPARGGAALDPDAETELWTGHASWKSLYIPLLVWLAVTGIAAILVALIARGPLGWQITLAVGGLIILVVLARGLWRIWSLSYRITTQRLFVRRGILTRTVDQTELLRVDDVKMRQTLLDRLIGTGVVEVMSSDRTDARIQLVDIDDPEKVTEFIRRHTRTVQRRTLFMEQL